MIDLLQGVVEHGTGQAAALNGFAAGKTGTSQDYRDAWFIGFNDALVVGVWLGNDDDSPMKGVVGGSLPASIWKQFMTQATPLLNQQGTPIATVSSSGELAQSTSGLAQPNGTTIEAETSEGSSEPAGGGACDSQACSSFYHSFRASDCTYQPYSGGPRQICEK